jgi:hypothetical protein
MWHIAELVKKKERCTQPTSIFSQGLQKSAGLDRLVRQTELISHIESMLFSRLLHFLPQKLLSAMHHEALVVPHGYSRTFTVRPNDLREDRLPKDITEGVHWLVSTRWEREREREKEIEVEGERERERKIKKVRERGSALARVYQVGYDLQFFHVCCNGMGFYEQQNYQAISLDGQFWCAFYGAMRAVMEKRQIQLKTMQHVFWCTLKMNIENSSTTCTNPHTICCTSDFTYDTNWSLFSFRF